MSKVRANVVVVCLGQDAGPSFDCAKQPDGQVVVHIRRTKSPAGSSTGLPMICLPTLHLGSLRRHQAVGGWRNQGGTDCHGGADDTFSTLFPRVSGQGTSRLKSLSISPSVSQSVSSQPAARQPVSRPVCRFHLTRSARLIRAFYFKSGQHGGEQIVVWCPTREDRLASSSGILSTVVQLGPPLLTMLHVSLCSEDMECRTSAKTPRLRSNQTFC